MSRVGEWSGSAAKCLALLTFSFFLYYLSFFVCKIATYQQHSPPSYTLAVNQQYIAVDEVLLLKEGDECAIIPPISGG